MIASSRRKAAGFGRADLYPRQRDSLRAAAAQFVAQFDATPEAVDAWYESMRLVRSSLVDLCWPQPALGSTIRFLRGRYQLRFEALADHPGVPQIQGLATALKLGLRSPAGGLWFKNRHSVCSWIRRVYAVLRQEQPPIRTDADRVQLVIPSRIKELATKWERQPRLARMHHLIRRLQTGTPRDVDPVLFGSLAMDENWLPFADVDLCLIFEDDALMSTKSLMRTTKTFRRSVRNIIAIDAIQHHGPYLLFESDFDAYNESFLPLSTLRLATSLGPQPLGRHVHLVQDTYHALLALHSAARGIRDLLSRPARLADRYSAKYVVSLVLLLPALVCAALGEATDKGASFPKLKPLLGPEALRALEAMEAIRRNWHDTLQPPRIALQLADATSCWLGRQFNRWPSRYLQERLSDFLPGLLRLTDECEDLCTDRVLR